MRVDFIEYNDGLYYTAFMSCGVEMNRLIKRLWKNPYYDFSFCEMPHCSLNRIYVLEISYNDFTGRYDVALCGQETVIVNLMDSQMTIVKTVTYSYGKLFTQHRIGVRVMNTEQ